MDREFWRAAGIRALRTICQTAVASMGTAALITEGNWVQVRSAAALAGV